MLDLTGQQYGYLKVLRMATSEEVGNRRGRYCVCECQYINPSTGIKCGKIKIVNMSKLRSGRTKSCGCATGALIREAKRYHNSYEIVGDTIKVMLPNDEYFLVDREDEEVIKETYWYKSVRGYIVSDNYRGKRVRLNRIIANIDDPALVVDHRDGDPLNNRKDNLRICPQSKNVLNSKPKGPYGANRVSQNKHGDWTASITYEGKDIRIGTFSTKEEAVEARKEKELELYGEYSYFARKTLDKPTNL